MTWKLLRDAQQLLVLSIAPTLSLGQNPATVPGVESISRTPLGYPLSLYLLVFGTCLAAGFVGYYQRIRLGQVTFSAPTAAGEVLTAVVIGLAGFWWGLTRDQNDALVAVLYATGAALFAPFIYSIGQQLVKPLVLKMLERAGFKIELSSPSDGQEGK
jgi:hypothetical protein